MATPDSRGMDLRLPRLGPRRLLRVSALLALALAVVLIQPAAANSFRAPVVTAISAGFNHTCALTAAGGVECWGFNSDGQLGDGTTTGRYIPEAVTGLGSGVSAISAGWDHTCAVTTAGAVRCWGWNPAGQLGNGTTTNSTAPVAVAGLGSGVAAVSAGALHTCAVTTGGAVKCWGANDYGELGNGTTTSSTVPVAVTGLGSGVLAVSAGGGHTCALTTAGAVECWGRNYFGQLGDGTTTNSTVPIPVTGLGSGVARISAGRDYTCAVTSSGAAKCWGYNEEGQLGDGTTVDRTTPTPVSGLGSGVASIDTGWPHTCAVTIGGAGKCWGHNEGGELGDGTTTSSTVPVAVSGLGSGTVEISPLTNARTCGLTGAGSVKCWGYSGLSLGVPGHEGPNATPLDVQWFGIAVTVTEPVTPGVPFTVQARAADGYGNPLTGYNGSGTWSDLTGTLSPATPADFVDGTSITTATISASFTTDWIGVSSGGAWGQSNGFTPPPARIGLTLPPSVYAGVPFTVKATALDANGNKMGAYDATATWSDSSGQLTPAAPATFVQGVSITKATIPIAFKGDKLTITTGGVSRTSSTFGVIGPFTAITINVAKPVTAGSPFAVTAQAVDSVGNVVKNYNASATWSDLSGHLSPATPAAFVNGISKTSATVSTPYHADKVTIASGGKVKQSGAFDVLGPLSSISVTVPSTVTHGVPFGVKALAKDSVGNTLSTYNQTATWSSISGGLSPAVPSAFKNGVSTTSATFATVSTNNRITVTSGGINGQSNLFNVL